MVPTKACQDPKIKFLIKTSINIKVSFHTTKIQNYHQNEQTNFGCHQNIRQLKDV